MSASPRASWPRSKGVSNQKVEPTSGTLSTPIAAAHEFDEALADGQAQAGAAEAAGDGGVGLGEGREEAGQLFWRDADAGVLDLEAQAQGGGGLLDELHAQDDLSLVGEFDGVADQVDEHLFEAQEIADQMPRASAG